MSNLGTRHPTGEQLLHFADGEMTPAASEDIRGHLRACWECRHELEEIEQTIRECVRYRKIVVESCLPAPPQPWFDIYPRLERIDDLQQRQRLTTRVLEPLGALWHHPRRWAPAIATIVMIAVAVQQFRHAPSVQAAELLRKAVAAADLQPRRTRRIRIQTRTLRLTRSVGRGATPENNTGTAAMAGLELLFQAAHYSWEDPLSAKSYSDWRDQLTEKQDEITVRPDFYQLRTTTESGELAEATLKLSAQDLHTVEGTLQFRNHERVEISEVTDAPAASIEVSEGVAPEVSPRNLKSELRVRAQTATATPGEELAVIAVLHRLGADLGDPIEVTRAGAEILVTGTGIGPDRQQEIREELRTMQRVTVRFPAEASGETAAPDDGGTNRILVGPATGPVQTEIEKRLGGSATFEQFADQVFDLTDRFMSRAHALRRLAQRFPPEVEAQMTLEQRQILEQLRQDHTAALVENVTDVESRIRSALDLSIDDTQKVNASGSWQDETERLFAESRHLETMMVALLGASTEESQSLDLPPRVLASTAQLRKRAVNYQHMTTMQ